jgi:hypothetical protein
MDYLLLHRRSSGDKLNDKLNGRLNTPPSFYDTSADPPRQFFPSPHIISSKKVSGTKK